MIDTVFKFAGLSDKAKQKAIEWYSRSTQEDWEPHTDDINESLGMLGFEVSTEQVKLMNGGTREQTSFGYSIGYCQGDYANFSGEWRADRVDLAKLQTERPTDESLLSYGAQLMGVVLKWPGAVCRFSSPSPHACYIDWAYTDEDDPRAEAHTEDDEQLEGEMRDIIRSLFDWLYHELRSDLEWATSDENSIEGIEANDYDFDEDGERV